MRDKIFQVEKYRSLTPHVVEIVLHGEASTPFIYEAGQYIKIIHSDKSESPFSIANAPQQLTPQYSIIELHLFHSVDNQRAQEIFRLIKEEKQLTIRGPYGKCTASQLAPDRPIIFLARGTGFAPIKAVIEVLTSSSDYPAMHLYWSVAGWRDLYLRELVQEWVKTLRDFQFTAVLTREFLPPEETVKFGIISNAVLQDYPDLSSHQVYASGPQSMIYSSLYAFQQQGLARVWFFSDVFDYVP